MMDSSKNFLLTIHLGLTKIYITKENRVLKFVDDECVADYLISNEKLDSLKMLFENIVDTSNNDSHYAILNIKEEEKRENDISKVEMIEELVSHLSYDDFKKSLEQLNINNYYVDQIKEFYDCELSLELKKILSYTSNSCMISDKDNSLILLSHKDKMSNDKFKENGLIPLFDLGNGKYIGFDYKENSYCKFDVNTNIKEDSTKNIDDLILTKEQEDKEILDDLMIEKNLSVEEEVLPEVKMEDVINNIDEQFEKLNTGIIKKTPHEKLVIKDLPEEEIETLVIDDKDVCNNIEEAKEEDNNFDLDSLIRKIDEKIAELSGMDLETDSKNIQDAHDELIRKIDDKILESEQEKDKKEQTSLLEELNLKKSVNKKYHHRLSKNILEENNVVYNEDKLEEVLDNDIVLSDEEVVEHKNISSDILNSIIDTYENFIVCLNDTQKLVVEHLPYHEVVDEFGIIQIPEIELNDYNLILGKDLSLEKIKFVVKEVSHSKVDLLVKSAPNIVMDNGTKLRKNSHIILEPGEEITFKLNQGNAMETWTIKMERATFEKELREIDYDKILTMVRKRTNFPKLGMIEKYELQKTVMLFINLVMINKDYDALDELYIKLDNDTESYEEYITAYILEDSYSSKDNLPTYEDKKDYLEKVNYVKGLINSKWLDYPRYIFASHSYFDNDLFMKNYLEDLDSRLEDDAFYNYMKKLFREYELFTDLDEEGNRSLDLCLEYLSILYKKDPWLGENNKYKLEKAIMIGESEEDLALIISKLCRRGIVDYSRFVEYENNLKEKYRIGQLKYPIYSEYFEVEDIRMGDNYE